MQYCACWFAVSLPEFIDFKAVESIISLEKKKHVSLDDPNNRFFFNALYMVLFKKHARGVGVNRGISSSTQLLLSCKLILCERENSKGSASLEMLLCILFTAMSADFPVNAGYTEWFLASPS